MTRDWSPTRKLRWYIPKRPKDEPWDIGYNPVLQQKWKRWVPILNDELNPRYDGAEKLEEKWLDVPLVVGGGVK